MQLTTTIVVPDLGALALVHVSELLEGSTAWVESVGASFVLLKSSPLVPDGTTVIAPASGSPIAGNAGARWLIAGTPSATQWLLQPIWYIDPATGNDQNQGDTPATALATYAEFRRRIGSGPLSILMTVNLIGPISEFIFHDLVTGDASTGLTIQGQRTLVGTGTLSGVQLWNAATNTEGTITDAGLPVSWTASGFLGNLIELTSGASAGSVGWVAKDNGAKTARYSPFFDTSTFSQGTPVIGNTYAVYTLTLLTQPINIRVFGDGFVTIADVHVSTGGSTTIHTQGSDFLIASCFLEGFDTIPTAEFTSYAATRLHCRLNAETGQTFLNNAFSSAQYVGAFDGGFVDIETQTLLQGSFLRASIGGLVQVEDGAAWVAIFDNTEAIRAEANSGMTFLGRTFGQGITATGISTQAGAVIAYTFTPAITAPAVQVSLGGVGTTYAALPATNAAKLTGVVLV